MNLFRSLLLLPLFFITLGADARPVPAPADRGGDVPVPTVGKLWGRTDYDGKPWVRNVSRENKITRGLDGRHLAVWASHGRYYNNSKGRWSWQRPNLFCTNEDLFTQTIVVPYLIPMLENAGAVVFTPRERDWQTAEYIVDNDSGLNTSAADYNEYAEHGQWQPAEGKGFAAHGGHYVDGENPFTAGTARTIRTTRRDGEAYIIYRPNFEKAGRYAVYVSYTTPKEGAVDDAHYTVFHKGQATEFRVNQRMGGGTWVYLGTFDFDAGQNIYNCVMLTNQSNSGGWVTADAVRFGGGMGTIARGGMVSGYPRALEGARYTAQWSGTPYYMYSTKGGQDDYGDDINVRSLMTNWLAGGSPFVPTRAGLGVPIELSLAVHSDAGYSPDGTSLQGSLAICTTGYNDGRLASGITRQSSKRLAEALLANLDRDLKYRFGKWNRRYLWDRNYSETRLPEVPSAIIETLSHQNFPDMLMAQDPVFRFVFARSLYKTILRFVTGMHGDKAVVQPLPPRAPAVEQVGRNKVRLTWQEQSDPLEPTAEPKAYKVYTAAGRGGFDNGQVVKRTSMDIKVEPGVVYNFRITAVNKGGESFPTEVVSACINPSARRTVLVVNGFTRLSSPAVINDDTRQGFDLDSDPGVSYGLTAGWAGRQTVTDRRQMGREGPGALGYGGDELAGQFIMGNTFDYTRTHADALAATGMCSVMSSSVEAVEQHRVRLDDYAAVDYYMGLQRYLPGTASYYKTFGSALRKLLDDYLAAGGSLFASGAYVASDMRGDEEQRWLADRLHCTADTSLRADSVNTVTGSDFSATFYATVNADHYAATHVDVLKAGADAVPALHYANGDVAAVSHVDGRQRAYVMGFPFACITDKDARTALMRRVLTMLLAH